MVFHPPPHNNEIVEEEQQVRARERQAREDHRRRDLHATHVIWAQTTIDVLYKLRQNKDSAHINEISAEEVAIKMDEFDEEGVSTTANYIIHKLIQQKKNANMINLFPGITVEQIETVRTSLNHPFRRDQDFYLNEHLKKANEMTTWLLTKYPHLTRQYVIVAMVENRMNEHKAKNKIMEDESIAFICKQIDKSMLRTLLTCLLIFIITICIIWKMIKL